MFGLVFVLLAALSPAAAHEGLHEQIAQVTKQIQAEPRNAEIYLKRAELYRLHEEGSRALQDYSRAEQLNPALFVVDLGRGKLFPAARSPRPALAALNRFLARPPEHHEALLTRARVFAQTKRTREALEDYRRVLANAREPEIYLERARVCAAAGRLAEAVRSLDEGGATVSLQLAALDYELEQKLYKDALRRLERLTTAAPRRETWLARRGAILLQARRPREARDAFREALDALETLPPPRRYVRANQELEKQIRAGLAQAQKTKC
jgi:tetratricopeptide (TPR) repeat protein